MTSGSDMSAGRPISVAVVIPTCNRPASLEVTLQALARCDRSQAELVVVVVNNGPDEATNKVAQSYSRYLPLKLFSKVSAANATPLTAPYPNASGRKSPPSSMTTSRSTVSG